MSLARPTHMLLLTVLTIGCGRREVETRSPEGSGRVAVAAVEAAVTADEAEAATGDTVDARGAPQTISFADDADPEPTMQVQAAPKRPPIPRFRLFGTREQDGPN